MAEDILDDNIRYARFKKPMTLEVDKVAWEKTCDELQKKSMIGTFIFLGIGTLVSIFFGGMLVFVACLGLAVFLNVGVRRRFSHLRTLSDHVYTISGTQIIDTYQGEKETMSFNKIKNIEFQNWGIELDSKKKRKMSDKDKSGLIMIPKDIKDYGRVLVTFEHLA